MLDKTRGKLLREQMKDQLRRGVKYTSIVIGVEYTIQVINISTLLNL
ncbi:hypothetical protein LINPERHAP1_LOCUS40532 [Linum perenne]